MGGFIFPVLFVVAAILGWQLLPDLFSPHVEPDLPPVARYNTTTSDDPRWKEAFYGLCESPAETTFLEAMLSEFNFVPDNGVLRTPTLTLALQVKIAPYRLDFLANDWLAIEIDGAAYHSSPEAIEHDRERDLFLQGRGYDVLRIPAKVVFNEPSDAVRSVRTTIAGRRQTKTIPKTQTRADSRLSIGSTLSAFGKALEDINAYVESAAAIEEALKKPRETFEDEKSVFDVAIDLAAIRLNTNQELMEEIDRKYERFTGSAMASIKPDARIIPDIIRPKIHPKPEINEEIMRKYDALMSERSSYFKATRKKCGSITECRSL